MTATTEVPTSVDAAATAPTIQVSQVSKFYGDVVAVSDISFTLEPGVTALLGPNGAGKSTMLEMLTGLLRPSAGTIEILGRAVRGDRDLYRSVGLVPEQEHMYPFLTARDFLYLNAVLQEVPNPESAVARVLNTVDLVEDADPGEPPAHRPQPVLVATQERVHGGAVAGPGRADQLVVGQPLGTHGRFASDARSVTTTVTGRP